MEPITVDVSKQVKYTPSYSCAAGALRGCYLAIGTTDSLLMFFQIGNRGYGSDVEDDSQQEEPNRIRLSSTLTASHRVPGEDRRYGGGSGGS